VSHQVEVLGVCPLCQDTSNNHSRIEKSHSKEA
jgi:hypothetical protein